MSTIAPPASDDLHSQQRPAPQVRTARTNHRRRRFSFVGVLFTALVLVGPVLAITLATWGYFTSRQISAETRELNEPLLSAHDRTALSLPDSVVTLFGQGGAAAVVAAFDGAAPGTTRFTEVVLYTDYAVAIVQRAGQPAQLDQLAWHSGRVGAASPHPGNGDAQAITAQTFTIGDIDWSAVTRAAGSAVALTGVRSGAISHVIIDRSTFDEALPITIRIFVSGPKSNGSVEISSDGDVLAVY